VPRKKKGIPHSPVDRKKGRGTDRRRKLPLNSYYHRRKKKGRKRKFPPSRKNTKKKGWTHGKKRGAKRPPRGRGERGGGESASHLPKKGKIHRRRKRRKKEVKSLPEDLGRKKKREGTQPFVEGEKEGEYVFSNLVSEGGGGGKRQLKEEGRAGLFLLRRLTVGKGPRR